MFTEGLGHRRAAPKVGAPAPLINALVVNAKAAADEFWRLRGYDKMTPDEIQARLGYRLDREEFKGYVLTGALHRPLLSPIEARFIGRRIDNSLIKKAALGKQLAAHKKRGTSNAALLQETATLSLAPPPRASAESASPSTPALPSTPVPVPQPAPAPSPPPLPLTDAEAAVVDAVSKQRAPPVASCGARIKEMLGPDRALGTGAFVQELKSSLLVGKAIVAAHNVESHMSYEMDEWAAEGTIDDETEEEVLHANITYQYALKRLDKAYPALTFGGVSSDTTLFATEENSKPCLCGKGRAGMWPWQLQHACRDFCDNADCWMLDDERSGWLRASMGAAFDDDWWQSPRLSAEMVRKASQSRCPY